MGGKKRILLATVSSAALLVPLAVFGGSSFAHGFASAWQYGHHGSGGSQYQYGKVTICHHTHSQKHQFVTITVSAHAAHFFMAHGDTAGACPAQTPSPAKHDDDGDADDQGQQQQGNGDQHAVVSIGLSHGDHGHGSDHGGHGH